MGYLSYAIKRTVSAALILVGASVVIFLILRLIPGDPAQLMLGADGTPEAVETQRRRLGLHLPIWEQYIFWIEQIVTLDLGNSILTGTPIIELLQVRLPRSVLLATVGILIAIGIAFPIGILAAIDRNSRTDYFVLFFSQLGISIPSFVLGVFLIMIFAAFAGILPSGGYVSPLDDPIASAKHLVLPGLTLGIINAAILTRFVRSEMLEELSKDYVRAARAYGHPEKRITRKYVLKNALIPAVTVVGIQFGGLIGGLVITEQVFTYPGMGTLILDALHNRDYPVLQISLLVIAAGFIFINLVVDLVYGLLDPRIKY